MMAKRFCFKIKNPTFHNLSLYLKDLNFSESPFYWLSNFNDNHFLFHPKAAEQLEFKHLLAELVNRYCAEIMPMTFAINDTNWPQILAEIAANEAIKNETWILKPSLLNNGQGIKIFENLAQIEAHFLSSQRFAGEHVLQLYIKNPDLLRGHKYSIRIFVVAASHLEGGFIYPQGYFNVATSPLSLNNYQNLNCHLTNEHLNENETNVIQIPSREFSFFPELYPKIKNISAKILKALNCHYPDAFDGKKTPSLAVFGFDFLVDEAKNPWLLEINHGPCFPIEPEHPLQKHLYKEFWQTFIQAFVLPITEKNWVSCQTSFESL